MSKHTLLQIPFSTWTQVVTANDFHVYHRIEGTESREVWAGNNEYIYRSFVDSDDFTTTYSGSYEANATVVESRDDAIANIIGLGPLITAPLTSDGRPRVAMEKPDSSRVTLYSHDWSDKTTWYETAVQVVGEQAVDSGDRQTYILTHQYLIDAYHGRITQEDYLVDANGNSYRVSVTVSGTTKTEKNPFNSIGDFTVDYTNGTLTFDNPLQAGDSVLVTYHYATSSLYTLKPEPGKKLSIDMVEVQFSEDVEPTDTVLFQLYGLVDIFAPQYVPNPYPPGTLIPLGDPLTYKTMRDFMNDAIKSYVKYPALGGAGWRGMPTGVYVFDWDYIRSTVLRSDYGLEIRVFLEHDTPFNGTYATATFYCGSDDL